MNIQLSYAITTFSPQELTDKFLKAKQLFGLTIEQKLKQENGVITKNTAHITIKNRFYLKENIQEENLVSALDYIKFSPVEIRAEEVKVFNTKKWGNVLVILVEKSKELQNLHEIISDVIDKYIIIDPQFERENVKPHLSVIYSVPDNKVEEAVKYINSKLIPVAYKLDNINLLVDIPNITKERAFVKKYYMVS